MKVPTPFLPARSSLRCRADDSQASDLTEEEAISFDVIGYPSNLFKFSCQDFVGYNQIMS